jgi:hypothetical protein
MTWLQLCLRTVACSCLPNTSRGQLVLASSEEVGLSGGEVVVPPDSVAVVRAPVEP